MSRGEDDVRHITSADANLFVDLGFPENEAVALMAEAAAEIEAIERLKQQLMAEISDWISESRLKQAEAAEHLKVSRPRVSDVVNRKTAKFTIDTLIAMLQRAGKDVQIAVQ